MTPNPSVMKAVEALGYRVTVGDVAAKVGLEINLVQRELLTLATETNGHLQVSESGDVAYLFPRNFREILLRRFLGLKIQEFLAGFGKILFYLLRISFGVILILSLFIIIVSIIVILLAISLSSNDNNSNVNVKWDIFPIFWLDDLVYLFHWSDEPRPKRLKKQEDGRQKMGFLESVFSFLFGDGNPNRDWEELRWKAIATVIKNYKGAVVAEQIAPYLDQLNPNGWVYEEYMLPVLAKFDGRPEVSPEGEIIYHFPLLQITAKEQEPEPISPYLRESLWQFSQGSSGQIMLAIVLGCVNFVGALMLGDLLTKISVVGSKNLFFLSFVSSIYPILLLYGIGFLTIPLIRYFWLQYTNSKISQRNWERQKRTEIFSQPNKKLKRKLKYAQKFAKQSLISQENLAYTTERDLLSQEVEQSAKLDGEWERRLNQSSQTN